MFASSTFLPQLTKNPRDIIIFHRCDIYSIYICGGELLIATRPVLFAARCDNRCKTKDYRGEDGEGGGVLVRNDVVDMWGEVPLFYGEHAAELGLFCLLLICLCPRCLPPPTFLL
jgi:hypothetical protein